MIGILFGSPIFGSMSDKIGRKKTTCVASAIFIVAGPLVALAPNFETLMLARFILGASSPGIYATCFVLGNKCHHISGSLCPIGHNESTEMVRLVNNWDTKSI